MDYDHILNEVAYRMAASQLNRSARHSYTSTPNRWSGRVEKSRSQHTSPAIHERRRAYSTTRSPYQYQAYQAYNLPQQMTQPRQSVRPFSWHSTSTSYMMPMSTMPQLTPPAMSTYHPSPYANSTHMAYDAPRSFYQDLPELEKPSGPASMTSETPSSYSSFPDSSPNWQFYYDEKTPVMSTQTYTTSPFEQPNWYDTRCQQQSPMEPLIPMTSLPPIVPQPSLEMMMQEEQFQPQPTFREPMVQEEEQGEVLIALGLYDAPSLSDISAKPSTLLKLTETWQPPPEDEDEDEEECSQEEENPISAPSAGQSWFHT
ncbi:hypothetical protein BT63DRAFT_416043 [Microthyrium microscopicum]|uniref:Uncharacterized protein n=1 Tax=Microthyrium microscopicum TaxID=703497 RepID=A0A6A6U3X4_9PEZI|nr:hypothetical protein BT63DRAFT_416043 [Microthyrium microscopicum]